MAFGHALGPDIPGRQLSTTKKAGTGKRRTPKGKADASAGRAEVEAILGYCFKEKRRLDRALTHASAVPGSGLDNERLEFLGDRVLGLVITEELLARFPSAPEGELAPRLNRLVRGTTCAVVARHIGLGAYLKLAPSEEAQGGRDKTAILADAIEAVIGAMFVDGGLEPASQFIRRAWADQFGSVSDIPRDAKTRLQEHLHSLGHDSPSYRVVSRTGADHEPHFVVEADGGPVGTAQGEAGSKRQAEQRAAAALLDKLAEEDGA